MAYFYQKYEVVMNPVSAEDVAPTFTVKASDLPVWHCEIRENTDQTHKFSPFSVIVTKNGVHWDTITVFDDLEEILDNSYSKEANSPFNTPRKTFSGYLSINHVFDENKSVKWNREAVENYNQAIKEYKATSFIDTGLDNLILCMKICIKNYFAWKAVPISDAEVDRFFENVKEMREHFIDQDSENADFDLVDRCSSLCSMYCSLIKIREDIV